MMVLGEKKSGATYIRQLMLDNVFLAPLDTTEFDHHTEPAMRATREAMGVFGNELIKRDEPRKLAKDWLDPSKHPRIVEATLTLLVTKDPIAWLVSALKRPAQGPARRPSELFNRAGQLLQHLLARRYEGLKAALELGAIVDSHGGRFEVVSYEDAVRDAGRVVRDLAEKHGLARRRGGDLLTAQHHTGDVPRKPDEATGHGAARRSRYGQHGPFTRE